MAKSLFVVLVMIAFLAGAVNVSANRGPVEVKINAKPGTVTYRHAEHTERGMECSSCHHKGVLSGTCRRCHDGNQAPDFKVVAHKICWDCHKASSGPTECKGCHVK